MTSLPLIRPAIASDLERLYSFAQEAGVGLSTLPKDRKVLKEKIAHSVESFAKSLDKPHNELYLFVLEWQGIVVGCSALISRIGVEEPFWAYHLRREHQLSPFLKIDRELPVLHCIEATKKPTEVSTLFLTKEYRNKEWGKLLSFARFLFIASKPLRFASRVIAELRGISDSHGRSPFWEAVGRPFYDMSFEKALHLRYTHPQIIAELFPKHPIYPWLLPSEASLSIGQIHPDTLPAKHILESQGFSLTPYVDIFDAGPHFWAPVDEIVSIRESRETVVSEVHAGKIPSHMKAMIANCLLDYRATVAPLALDENKAVILTQELASDLLLQEGDKVRILPFP